MDKGKTLQAMAEQIRQWQEGRGLSDSALLRQFPALGTSRTWLRARKGDVGQIDADRWIQDYRGVLNVIAALETRGQAEDTYDDLGTVEAVRVALIGAMGQNGNSRFVLVQGPSGSGKTTALQQLRERFGARRVVLCEANDLWRNGRAAVSAMLSDILAALGVADAPVSTVAKLDKAVGLLSATRVCLAIDEAHHMGPSALNVLKTLLNRTPGEFVLCAMGTLWRRLETQAYEEARQLTQNRLFERIRFEAAAPEDVELMLTRRLALACDVKGAVRAVSDAAWNSGGLKFAAKVCREAAGLAGPGQVDMETIGKAIARVQMRS